MNSRKCRDCYHCLTLYGKCHCSLDDICICVDPQFSCKEFKYKADGNNGIRDHEEITRILNLTKDEKIEEIAKIYDETAMELHDKCMSDDIDDKMKPFHRFCKLLTFAEKEWICGELSRGNEFSDTMNFKVNAGVSITLQAYNTLGYESEDVAISLLKLLIASSKDGKILGLLKGSKMFDKVSET